KRSDATDPQHRSRQPSTRRAVGDCMRVSMLVLSVVIVTPSSWFGDLVAGRVSRRLGVSVAAFVSGGLIRPPDTKGQGCVTTPERFPSRPRRGSARWGGCDAAPRRR